MLKSNEKFIAFVLLGVSLVFIAGMVYLKPLSDTNANSSSIQIINTIVGALTLAFGGVANALFRISDTVKVDNKPSEPIPVDAAPGPEVDPAPVHPPLIGPGELPPEQKI